MAVELTAKTLKKSRLSAKMLYERMRSDFGPDLSDQRVSITKDNRNTNENFYTHISKLFNISKISQNNNYVNIMTNLSIIPYVGLKAETFHDALNLKDYNDIEDLIEQGWIRQDMESDVISLHPVISNICVHEFKPDGVICRKIIDYYSLLYIPENFDNGFTNIDKDIVLLFSLLHVAKSLSADKTMSSALLFVCIADIYLEKENFSEALNWYGLSYEIQRNLVSPNYKNMVYILEKVALIYSNLDKNRTMKIYTFILQLLKHKCSDEYILIAKICNSIYINDPCSDDLYIEGLEKYLKKIPSTYKYTIQDYIDISTIYHTDSREKAFEYANKAYNLAVELYGESSLVTAKVCDEIGEIYFHEGNYFDDRSRHRSDLDIRFHVDWQEIAHNKYINAIQWLKKAFDISCKIYGEYHHRSVAIYSRILTLYMYVGDTEKALSEYMRLVNMIEKENSENIIVKLTYYHNLGVTYEALSDNENALIWYLKAKEIIEDKFGYASPRLILVYKCISNIYADENIPSEARIWFDKAWKLKREEKFKSNDFYNLDDRFLDPTIYEN